MARPDLTGLFLRLFVVSIVVNAVLGIWALLSGDFGETQGKVLATSFLVSAAMLSVLLNTPAIGRRVRWPVPAIGAATGAAGFALFIVMLWAEVDDERWFKFAGSLLVVAAAATLVSSLALVPPLSRLRWLPPLADVLIAALAVTVVIGLWAEPDVDWYGRLVGVEAVLVAAATLLIPVLSRFGLGRAEPARPAVPGEPAIRFCPSCGRPVDHRALGTGQPVSCDSCGLVFEVATPSQGGNEVVLTSGRAGPAGEPDRPEPS